MNDQVYTEKQQKTVNKAPNEFSSINSFLYHFVAFVDQKAFNRVPRKIIRWAMWKLGVEVVSAYGSGYVCGCEEHGKGW